MGSIILLALAAAVYPQLLAVVVIILTRPNPQPLLWACYLASLLVSVASSVLIFAAFQSWASVARHKLRSARTGCLSHGRCCCRVRRDPDRNSPRARAPQLGPVDVARAPATGNGGLGSRIQVNRFSRWMRTNKLIGVAAIVALFGIFLIGRGISGLG